MRHSLLILPLMLAACAQHPRPYAPVDNVHYAALGQEPFWLLSIGDDRIVLTFGPGPGARPRDLDSHSWPRTLPRTVDGVRRWESGSGTEVISVEAAPGPCEGSRGAHYRDQVRVRLSGRELVGCGGPLLGSERG
jgi:uncharacterized membrane protein